RSALFRRQPRFVPSAPTAIHRLHVRVAHLLQVVRHQRRPESPSAVQDHFRTGFRHALLDVAFDHSAAHVHGAGQVSFRPFVVFPHIHQQKSFSAVHSPLDVRYIGLLHPRLRVIYTPQELRRVLHVPPWSTSSDSTD